MNLIPLAWTTRIRAFFATSASSRLRRLTLLAQAALAFERLARALAPAMIVVGFFVALSWTGLWLGANSYARMAGTVAFVALFAVALFRLRDFSFPSAAEARAALDLGDVDAPAATLADRLANDGDPQTQGLWRLHLRRAARNAARLRPIKPSPRLWTIDPYALGALALLALGAGAFVAGPEKYARIAAAFDWRRDVAATAPFRVDAWIDPPAYTGRPPIVLPIKSAGAKISPVTAPVGSTITVRAAGGHLHVTTKGRIVSAPPSVAKDAAKAQRRFILRGDGSLRLWRGGAELAEFSLRSLPDAPPTITALGRPRINLHGSFSLAYRINDDYGARDAEISAKPAAGAPVPQGHALVAPPSGKLDLPATPTGLGQARSTIDWSDSPYGGTRVDLTLRVHDEGGNEGRAVIRNFVLPRKKLTNPLAKALAEQSRILALDSAKKNNVLEAIDALMIAPELFTPKAGVYLGLRYAHDSLRRARNDADLVAVSDFLWQMALRIDEGDMPQAERNLRAAEKALRDALKRGASPQEIARLTAQLQKAMDAFLAELAKKAAHNKAQSSNSLAGRERAITAEDLKSMLQQLAEAAKLGDKQAAQELLDRMQDMLENLRLAGKAGASQAARDRETLREIDRLMREQQKLRDDTYADQRRQSGRTPPQARPGGQGEKPQGQGQAPAQELERRQSQLRQQLNALRQQREGAGGAPKSLNEAEKAMGQAEKALRGRNDPSAVAAQGRALEALRKGASELAAQAQKGAPGEAGMQMGEGRPGMRGQSGESPFGDPFRRNSIDPTAEMNARKVLEELRRRLSDPNRAREELDYLERLIKPD